MSQRNFDYVLIFKFAAFIAFIIYAAFLVSTLNNPVIDAHGFRQTQTAISIFYMLQDGLAINYQTPVLGYPWKIPFEAPIYHLSVAAFSAISPLGLDANGRIVSAVYWLGCLWVGALILRQVLPDLRSAPWIFILLALASPLYMFWSRTFMIETTALFFGLVFLFGTIKYASFGGVLNFGIVVLGGVFCILAKATTWPAFVAAGGLYVLVTNAQLILSLRPATLSARKTRIFLLRGTILFASVILTLYIGLLWTAHGDHLKEATHFGQHILAENLSSWNYGTPSDRWHSKLWGQTILGRAMPEALGSFWYFAAAASIAIFTMRRKGTKSNSVIIFIICCGVAFLLPFFIFTNLHNIHNYYQSSASIFIIAFSAVAFAYLLESGAKVRLISGIALVLLVAGQYFEFFFGYYQISNNVDKQAQRPVHQMALMAKARVPENTAILAVGVDWSSQFHYYAERRGMAMALWFNEDRMREMANDPAKVFGPLDIGGILQCKNSKEEASYPKAARIMSEFINAQLANAEGSWGQENQGHCVLYYRKDI